MNRFNSSGATIIADRNEDVFTRRVTRNQPAGTRRLPGNDLNTSANGAQQLPSHVDDSRMLMPQDTFGRELDALRNGHDSMPEEQIWSNVSYCSHLEVWSIFIRTRIEKRPRLPMTSSICYPNLLPAGHSRNSSSIPPHHQHQQTTPARVLIPSLAPSLRQSLVIVILHHSHRRAITTLSSPIVHPPPIPTRRQCQTTATPRPTETTIQ